MGPLVLPLIGAGASLVGQGINAMNQGRMNRKTREWNEKMMNQQRAWALEDWNRQNAYNDPSAQMARLKAAGLNPNLVYDNGAQMQSASIRAADSGSWKPEAATFDLGNAFQSGLSAYYDVRMKQAQTNNLETQNTVMAQEAALKAAQVANVHASTAKTQFETGLAQELKTISLETAATQLKNMQQSMGLALDANERAEAQNSMSLREAAARIVSMRIQNAKTEQERKNLEQTLKLLQQDEKLKEFDINLRKGGITASDPVILRMLSQALSDFNPVQMLKNLLGNLFK